MINIFNTLSDTSKFTTDSLKNSKVLNTKKTENENELHDNSNIKTDDKRFDSFEHQKQEKTAGTYHIMKNDDGKLEVVFDGANNISSSESNEISPIDVINENDKTNTDNKVNSKDEKPTIVVTTSDLSAVEREIKELKQQQKRLQQQLNSAPEEQKQQIQAELDRVTQELEKKDTDAYRNSHDNSRQYTLS